MADVANLLGGRLNVIESPTVEFAKFSAVDGFSLCAEFASFISCGCYFMVPLATLCQIKSMIVSTDGFFNAILEPNLIMTLIVPIKGINESTGFSETEHFA